MRQQSKQSNFMPPIWKYSSLKAERTLEERSYMTEKANEKNGSNDNSPISWIRTEKHRQSRLLLLHSTVGLQRPTYGRKRWWKIFARPCGPEKAHLLNPPGVVNYSLIATKIVLGSTTQQLVTCNGHNLSPWIVFCPWTAHDMKGSI